MKNIGLLIAMDKEMKIFTSSLQNMLLQTLHGRKFYSGSIKDKMVTAVISGIGNVNSALCTADLINNFNADMIINIGFSGGLDSSLQIGDFVVGDDIVYHDLWCGDPYEYGQVAGLPLYFHSDPELCALLSDYKHGLICCGDKFITTADEIVSIKKLFPQALAVDMESASIAQTCYLYNKPMISIRQISDTPGIEYHNEQYDNFWKNAPENSFKMLNLLLEKL